MYSRAIKLFLVATMGLASIFAQDQKPRQPSAPAATTFSEQDKADAQKQLKAVGELFGVKKEQAEPEKKDETAAPTTMANVADKALTMVGNAVGAIAGIVQKVAPEVWEIMVRQQYAKAISGIIVPFGLILLTWMMALVSKKFFPFDKSTNNYFTPGDNLTGRGVRAAWTTLVPTIVTALLGIWLFCRLSDSVLYLINPKYYAVQDLLQMLLNR